MLLRSGFLYEFIMQKGLIERAEKIVLHIFTSCLTSARAELLHNCAHPLLTQLHGQFQTVEMHPLAVLERGACGVVI